MKYVAAGRVHPERVGVHIPKTIWEREKGSISFECAASQILVMIDDPRVDNHWSAKYSAEHVSGIFISVLGFVIGCSYAVEITQVVDDEGILLVPSVQMPELVVATNNIDIGTKIDSFSELARKDISFRFALKDYVAAIGNVVEGAFLCYRAIESLSKALSPGLTDGAGWKSLHKALVTDKASIDKYVTNYAKPIRHGSWVELAPMNQDQRVEMLSFTRELIEKYIAYCTAGYL